MLLLVSSLLAIWYTNGTNFALGTLSNTAASSALTAGSDQCLNHKLHKRYTTWNTEQWKGHQSSVARFEAEICESARSKSARFQSVRVRVGDRV